MQIALTQRARLMMKYAVQYDKNEIAGFGKTRVQDGIIIVEDIIIPPQFVGGAHAEMELPELSWAVEYVAREYQASLFNDFRIWWHSHPGGTSPSGTDTNTMRMLAEQNGDWYAGIVTNQNGEYTGFGHIVAPFDLPVGKIPVITVEELDADLHKSVLDICREHVKQGKPGTPPFKPGGTGSQASNGTTSKLPPALGGMIPAHEANLRELSDTEFVTLVAQWLASGALDIKAAQIPMLAAGK